jgi:glutamine amidotransferase
MKRPIIGIIDYGAGNLSSVKHSLESMGYRSRTSNEREVLDQTDLLLLPGVGAFPSAMEALHERGLGEYVIDKARQGTPLIGICLGMQLLADCSHEIRLTSGLGLIPGEVVPLTQTDWHIGWNNVEILSQDTMFSNCDGQAVYFNHSHVVHTEKDYCIGVSRIDHATEPFTIAVRRKNVVGLQFHPEKSQQAGRQFLTSMIEGLLTEND